MNAKEEIQYLKEQVKLYRFDYLTGLKQRFDFDYDIRKKFRGTTDFYVGYYDIDGLHKRNRTEGFAAGDQLIVQVASDISHQNIPHSTYRISGDEFYTICCDLPTEEVSNATYVSVYAKDFGNVDELLKALDDNMITEKTKRKTRRIDD
jgi:GGDEF domain-containing protein